MKGIDLRSVRDFLDELHIPSSYDDDGDLMVVLHADEDFVYDVVVYLLVQDDRLTFLAQAFDYEPTGNPYELANRHNCRNTMPMAVVRDGIIRMEYSFLLDEEVSHEYVRDNCVRMPISSIWHAFMNLERE